MACGPNPAPCYFYKEHFIGTQPCLPFAFCLWLFCATMAELNSYKRNGMAYKAGNIYHLARYRKFADPYSRVPPLAPAYWRKEERTGEFHAPYPPRLALSLPWPVSKFAIDHLSICCLWFTPLCPEENQPVVSDVPLKSFSSSSSKFKWFTMWLNLQRTSS